MKIDGKLDEWSNVPTSILDSAEVLVYGLIETGQGHKICIW